MIYVISSSFFTNFTLQVTQIGIESSITKASKARISGTDENTRKRPGLGDSIVPSKKVQKHYKRIAAASRTANTSN